MAIMAGTTALVARAIGSGDEYEAAQVTRASLGICLLISFFTVILLWVGADFMIGLFGLDEESRKLSIMYTQILVGFTPVFAISMVLGTAQRAAGDAKTPLYIGLITNIVNIILLIGLVEGRYGMPEMGVVGAALAGGLAFTFNSILVLGLWFGKKLAVSIGKAGSMTYSRFKTTHHHKLSCGIRIFYFSIWNAFILLDSGFVWNGCSRRLQHRCKCSDAFIYSW